MFRTRLAARILERPRAASLVLNIHGAKVAGETWDGVDPAVVPVHRDVVRRRGIRLEHEQVRRRYLPGSFGVVELVFRNRNEVLRMCRVDRLPLRRGGLVGLVSTEEPGVVAPD